MTSAYSWSALSASAVTWLDWISPVIMWIFGIALLLVLAGFALKLFGAGSGSDSGSGSEGVTTGSPVSRPKSFRS